MTDGVLLVGYGNALRTDDGLGWHAAGLLAGDPRLAGATVLQCHQLMPELALDISAAALVVLVDASHTLPAGRFTVTQVERADDAGTTWSHQLSPPSLVALAHELYGRAAEVFLVSAGVESLELGDRLSPVVAAELPRVVDAVADLVASHAARRGAGPAAEPADPGAGRTHA
jgi:hydrogenase maturation protease